MSKWIQKAIKRPGAFTKWCKGHGFSGATSECIEYAKKHGSTRVKRQANLAKTLKAMHHKKGLGDIISGIVGGENEFIKENKDNPLFGVGAQALGMVGDALSTYLLTQTIAEMGKDKNALSNYIDNIIGVYASGGVVGDKEEENEQEQTAEPGKETVEVEGGEVIKRPGGQVEEVKGPKHEQGGVKTNLEKGTRVFSKRIGVNGKSMAQRAKEREQKIKQYAKKAAKGDILSRLTAERQMTVNALQELADLQFQNIVGKGTEGLLNMAMQKENKGNNVKKYWSGTDGEDIDRIENRIPQQILPYAFGINTQQSTGNNTGTPLDPMFDAAKRAQSLGTAVGLTGNIIASVGPLATTIAANKNNRPFENIYRDYGKAAENRLARLYGGVMTQSEATSKSIENMFNSLIDNVRETVSNTAVRNANTLAGYAKLLEAQAKNTAATDQARNNIGNMLANLSLQTQRARLAGAQQADIYNRRQEDNFYTQLARNITNLGFGMQNLGVSLNKQGINNLKLGIMRSLVDTGDIGFTIGPNGEIQMGPAQQAATQNLQQQANYLALVKQLQDEGYEIETDENGNIRITKKVTTPVQEETETQQEPTEEEENS